MQIIFRKKEKKAIALFRQLEEINSQLLSIDTEISFLDEFSSEEKVQKLEKESLKYRSKRTSILGQLSNLA